ncbi:MAG TPA: hypothetical protein VGN64_12365, partial [Dyadobacter sp.]|nr:hypothetical protein [Dyadobacter sp.]
MDNAEDFYEQVKMIYSYACKHGTNSLQPNELPLTERSYKNFIIACHEGFRKAQEHITDMLIGLETELLNADQRLRVVRGYKNKKEITAISTEIASLKYQARILRKLGDSIAWHMALGHHYVIRRLFLGEPSPSLLSGGFKETRVRANELNEDPLSFALMSDITSFIQIGDIFRYNNGTYELIEIKSGQKNEEAQKIIESLNKTDSDSLHSEL